MSEVIRWIRVWNGSPVEFKKPRDGDAGYDLCTDVALDILPDRWYDVPTGIAVEIPRGYVGLIWSRSGLTFKQRFITWGAGVIDPAYRGEIRLSMKSNDQVFKLNRGDRIAQMIILPVLIADCVEVLTLHETERGNNGFGSTGT